jgi:hypothetical protein
LQRDYNPPKEKGIVKEILIIVIGAIAPVIVTYSIPYIYNQIFPSNLSINIHQQKDNPNLLNLILTNNGDIIAKGIEMKIDSPYKIIEFNHTKTNLENILFIKNDSLLTIKIDKLYGHTSAVPINLLFNPTNDNIINSLIFEGFYDGGMIVYENPNDALNFIKSPYFVLIGFLVAGSIIIYRFIEKKRKSDKIYQLKSSAIFNLSYIFSIYMESGRNEDDKFNALFSLMDFYIYAYNDKDYTQEIINVINDNIDVYFSFILYDNYYLLSHQSKIDHINKIFHRVSEINLEKIPLEIKNALYERIVVILEKHTKKI